MSIWIVALVGCAHSSAQSCRQSGGAELCLVDDGPAYKLTGKGFQSGSEVRMSVENDVRPAELAPQEIPPVRAGDDGVLPGPGGV